MADDHVVCGRCGQDWLRWYQVRASGRRFLLCPECDSVVLPGEDLSQPPRHWLEDLFSDEPAATHWDLIQESDAP